MTVYGGAAFVIAQCTMLTARKETVQPELKTPCRKAAAGTRNPLCSSRARGNNPERGLTTSGESKPDKKRTNTSN
ncbi:hypothetical protein JZ751_026236 [Albula glossodonta]|uniref:Uncharacterized protein n=1 Tax=Albula glossodonta TaxID=121402 RepID=A0A8T2P8W0_9TELE|nr:hypothetical protein JZ751_026236 [Albula glossodonta]